MITASIRPNREKLFFLTSFLLIFLFAGTIYAQTDDLPKPGLLPDSPFYFLKSWSESIGTFFTFGDIAKAKRFLHLSEKRLAEANALVAKGKPEVAARIINKYEEHLNKAVAKAEEAQTKGAKTDEVLAKVSEATLKHQEVLAGVYEKVPEQAKSAIEHALQVSIRGHENALKAISGQKKEELKEQIEQKKQQVEQKLEDLRRRGVPIPTFIKDGP